MTNENFTTWFQNPQVLKDNHSSWELATDNTNVMAFNRFACNVEIDGDTKLTCYKFQPLTTTTISGEPRFD